VLLYNAHPGCNIYSHSTLDILISMLEHRQDHAQSIRNIFFPNWLQHQHAPLLYLVLYSKKCTAEATMASFTCKFLYRRTPSRETKQNEWNKQKNPPKPKEKISSHMLTLKFWPFSSFHLKQILSQNSELNCSEEKHVSAA
jgi:hypothetical protein